MRSRFNCLNKLNSYKNIITFMANVNTVDLSFMSESKSGIPLGTVFRTFQLLFINDQSVALLRTF